MIDRHIGRVRIQISPLSGVVLTVLLYLDNGRLPLLCLAAALLHELGHIALLLLFRQPPAAVTVGPWGIRIERRPEVTLGYGQCAAISLAGPGVNVLCAGILWATGSCGELMTVHLITGLLHLLPIETLDGGQALKSLLCLRMAEDAAERLMLRLSVLLLLPLTALGFGLLLYTGYNFSLLALCFYLIGGIFFAKKH